MDKAADNKNPNEKLKKKTKQKNTENDTANADVKSKNTDKRLSIASGIDKISNMKLSVKLVIICLFALLAAFVVELYYNSSCLRIPDSQKGVFPISQDAIKLSGFEYVDGSYVMTGDSGHIEITTSMDYVNKLSYDVNFDKDSIARIHVVHVNTGDYIDADTIMDKNNRYLRTSTVKVDGHVGSVDLFFEEGAKGIELSNFKYINEASVNLRRFLMVFLIVAVVLAIIIFNTVFTAKVENGFLIIALLMGTLILTLLPSMKVAWDEAYHFRGAYLMSITGTAYTNEVIETYLNDEKVEDICYPQTKEENAQINKYMGEELNYTEADAGNIAVKAQMREIKDVGHLASSVGINIGRILKLPFPVMYLLGRICNLLMYITITYFAIKNAKVGKRVLTLIALMPTAMVAASTYSYDATLSACMFLAMSLMLSAFADEKTKITWKWYIAFVVSMFVVCSIKMVYAPMFILFVFMPKDRFKDKKTMYMMKAGLFVLCLFIVAIMILPTLINPPETGDTRDTELTSVSGQLNFIMTNKVYYASLLLKSIMGNMFDFMADISGLGLFGHMGQYPFIGVIGLMVILVAVTDKSEYNIKPYVKLLSGGLVFAVLCLIWTALYMSFTAVGYNEIVGVQGRYYIPLMLSTYVIFNSDKIKCDISPKVYNGLVLIAPMYINISIMFEVITNMFF